MFGKIKFSFLPTILIICLFVISGNLSSVCAQINQNNSKTNESSSNIIGTIRSQQESYTRRLENWETLKKQIPISEYFYYWQQKTQELPPDFEELTFSVDKDLSNDEYQTSYLLPTPFLPDPLRGLVVAPTMPSDLLLKRWNIRRNALISNYAWWVLGSSPPAPKNIIPILQQKQTRFQNGISQEVILRMGEDINAEINVKILFPYTVANKLFPALIIPAYNENMSSNKTHSNEWAQAAVQRGFIVCLYSRGKGLDGESLPELGSGTNAVNTLSLWMNADWHDLCKEAWSARRVADYLSMLPQIDKTRIGIVGEGFYAKSAICAAGADTRISATIAFSPGLGGFTPFRMLSEIQNAQGIEGITRENPTWFHPRLRFFSGRENYLPFEQTDMAACIAPRALYVATLKNDPLESVWGNEFAIDLLRRTYLRLGASPLRLFFQVVDEQFFNRHQIETSLDWIEYQWELEKTFPTQKNFYPTYEQWLKTAGAIDKVYPLTYPERNEKYLYSTASGDPITNIFQWTERQNEIYEQVRWVLGTPPAFFPQEVEFEKEASQISIRMRRAMTPPTLSKGGLRLSNGVQIDYYYPEGADFSQTNMPVVIWQPGFSVPGGYTCSELRGEPPFFAIAQAGFLVVTFDPIGCGTRIDEITHFYDRYPKWSLLGKMIQDVFLAVRGIRKIPFADSKRIYLVGYDIGGMTALHTAALYPDDIAGVVSIGGFAPMRENEIKLKTGGIARWISQPFLLPKLIPFIEHESHIPYDYNELMALIAPRPQFIIAFEQDDLVQYESLSRTIDSTAKIYKLFSADSPFFFEAAAGYKHYSPDINRMIINFLKRVSSSNQAIYGPVISRFQQ